MGQIRIFNRPPKAFEFDKEDLVIDNVRGDIYYKDDKNIRSIINKLKKTNILTPSEKIEIGRKLESRSLIGHYITRTRKSKSKHNNITNRIKKENTNEKQERAKEGTIQLGIHYTELANRRNLRYCYFIIIII